MPFAFKYDSRKCEFAGIVFDLKKCIHKIFTFLIHYSTKGNYMTTPIHSTPVACMHNGLSETSASDIIEHIGDFQFGNAIRDMIDPRSPNEVNLAERTVEQSNASTNNKDK